MATIQKPAAGIITQIDPDEREALKSFFNLYGQKVRFLEQLPTQPSGRKHSQKPIFTRRQLDWALESGNCDQALLEHMRAYWSKQKKATS